MIPAIDVHAHFGSAEGFPQKGKEKEFFSVSLRELEDNNRRADIKKTLFSPAEGIFPFDGHTIMEANERAAKLAAEIPWLYQWVIVNPLNPETYEQADKLLEDKKCVGIKIHPDAHQYQISQYGKEIFEFAARHQAVVETHTGDTCSQPEEFVPFADKYPDVRIILSHLGNNCDGDVTHQVRAILAGKNDNLYTDVSSVKSISFHLVEWAVREVGSERILFGTDTPLHHIGMMRSRIDYSDLQEREKENIFYRNALRLFPGVN